MKLLNIVIIKYLPEIGLTQINMAIGKKISVPKEISFELED